MTHYIILPSVTKKSTLFLRIGARGNHSGQVSEQECGHHTTQYMQRSCKDATDSTLRLSTRLHLVLGEPRHAYSIRTASDTSCSSPFPGARSRAHGGTSVPTWCRAIYDLSSLSRCLYQEQQIPITWIRSCLPCKADVSWRAKPVRFIQVPSIRYAVKQIALPLLSLPGCRLLSREGN